MASEDIADTLQRLPSLGEDPKERKRMLGVLAQRRYRQRRRQRKGVPRTPESNHESTSILPPNTNGVYSSFTKNQVPVDSHQALDDSDEMSLVIGPNDCPNAGSSLTWPSSFGKIGPQGMFDLSLQWDEDEFPVADETRISIFENSTLHASSQQSPSITSAFRYSSSLSVPCLDLVRAHVQMLSTILNTLEVPYSQVDTIWNPFAVSPFHASSNNNLLSHAGITSLPSNYRPTETQMRVMHHPIFDLLPWPNVRDKLLGIMTLPVAFRPERAKDDDENVVVQIKYDMFDPSGSTKIHGTEPMNGDMWEIGQVFFENWWWALDRSIIKRSNDFRQARGEPKLRLRKR